ncbi:MAG: DUF4838 domain-containing protein [Armatimonadetes bacterium]|nr:DUF4838 domain-containing protein [Armatimonadota bacterium]
MRGPAVLLALTLAAAGWADRLQPVGWTADPAAAAAVFDGDRSTAWQSAEPQSPDLSLTLDFGRPLLLHRVVLHAGANLSGFARAIEVQVGDDLTALRPVAATETLHEPDLDLRFNPIVGRLCRLQLTASAGYPWALAEVELYGSPDPASLDKGTVILLPDPPSPQAVWAAEELRYYLGEATGRFPAVRAGGVVDAELIIALNPRPTAEELQQLETLGEEGYVITRAGHFVRVVGASPRGLLYGCYEVLDRLGVKWLDPTPEGEYIPRGAALDLSYLPLAAKPAFAWRHLNGWQFSGMPRGWVLWTVRNRLNFVGQSDWWFGKLDRYLGRLPERGSYLYGYYPHSFSRVLPASLFTKHPGMFPMVDGKRVPYDAVPGGGLQFCTTSPETLDYVSQRVVETLRARPGDVFPLCPNDGGVWCECPDCQALDEPVEQEMYSDGRHSRNVSDRFFTFMDTVCRRVARELPGRKVVTIAYSNFDQPPRRLERLPDNLLVDVCQYGCSSHGVNECAENAEMKRRLEEWTRKCAHVGIYDYVFDQMRVQKLPLPYCRAINSELRWLVEQGITAYSTEGSGSGEGWLYSPWAYWVMARSLWAPASSWEAQEREFFQAYYQEAAEPMLAYYRALEDFTYETPVHWGSYNNVPTSDKFPPQLLSVLHDHLRAAKQAATTALTRTRVARQVEAIGFVENYLRTHEAP